MKVLLILAGMAGCLIIKACKPGLKAASLQGGTSVTTNGITDTIWLTGFGATGNDTINDSKALQKAIDYCAATGKTLFVPPGRYFIQQVNLRENITIKGIDSNCTFQKIFNGDYALGCNFSYLQPQNDPTGKFQLNNIVIDNIHFRGTSHINGFSEFKHLLNINGVTNVSITNCTFSAFNGDGLYIGSDVGVIRHNKKITVTNCVFNGVNNKNRNGITVIDGEDIVIANNRFENISSPNMPGAIDIEPDKLPGSIVKDISIQQNTFNNIGGNVGTISLVIPYSQHQMPVPVQNITINNNYLQNVANGIAILQANNATPSTFPQKITINGNNIINVKNYPLNLQGVSMVQVTNNVFDNFKTNAIIGATGTAFACANVLIKDNVFKNNRGNGVAIALHNVDGFTSTNNTFENIGIANGSYGIAILGETKGSSKNIVSTGDVVKGTGTTSFSQINPGHTTNGKKNKYTPAKGSQALKNFFPFNQ